MATVAVMGCDVHLDTVAAAVVDPTGRELAAVEVPNTVEGWDTLAAMAAGWSVSTVGIEGASGLGRAMAKTLDDAGFEIREVPTRLTARLRRIDGAGKTDPGDARSIARATLGADTHRWVDTPQGEIIRVLMTRRERLIATKTGEINQLRAILAELDPSLAAELGRLRTATRVRRVVGIVESLDPGDDPYRATLTAVALDIAAGCLRLLDTIAAVDEQIRRHLPPAGHALIEGIYGCGVIVAAQLVAQLAGTSGFPTDAKLAAWAGTAPLDASSGRQQRHRLNRHGNRQANRAIHTIVITQAAHRGDAADYIQRRITEGKTRREAIRAAKRHLTRRIWKILRDHPLT